jgi:SAM-dependent methyltransferase
VSRRDTRDAYDRTADLYVERIGFELSADIEAPSDLDLIDTFGQEFHRGAHVVDLGCGPGRAAVRLRAVGLDVVGVDLSFGMLAEGRRHHPELATAQGDLGSLPLRTGAFDGAVLWYSIVHSPADDLAGFFSEVRRVVIAHAPVLVAFQAGGGEAIHRDDVAGRPVSLLRMRHDPDVVSAALDRSGLHVESRVIRDALGHHEDSPQAFLLARAGGPQPTNGQFDDG